MMSFLAFAALVLTLVFEVPFAKSLSPDNKGAATQGPGETPGAASAPGSPVLSGDERMVKTIHSALADELAKNDATAIAPHLADDWTFTSSNGTLLNKSQFLKLIQSGELKFETLKFTDRNVRFYGITAVVTARSTLKAKFKGTDVEELQRSSDVFIRNDRGEWICVLTHTTRVAKK